MNQIMNLTYIYQSLDGKLSTANFAPRNILPDPSELAATITGLILRTRQYHPISPENQCQPHRNRRSDPSVEGSNGIWEAGVVCRDCRPSYQQKAADHEH